MPVLLGVEASSNFYTLQYIGVATYSNTFPTTFYPWSISGFGTKYTSATPGSLAFALTFNSSLVGLGLDSSPYIAVYPWSFGGFGTKYANPTTLPTGAGQGVAFDSTNSNVVLAHGGSPYVSAYPWSSGFGTKYANPATLPTKLLIGFGSRALINSWPLTS